MYSKGNEDDVELEDKGKGLTLQPHPPPPVSKLVGVTDQLSQKFLRS